MKANGTLIVTRMLLLDKHLSEGPNKVLLRVVFIDSFSSTVWLCRLDDHSWPFRVSRGDLEAEMDHEHGRYTIEPEDPWDGFIVGKSNPKSEALHRQRYQLIEPLINGDNEQLILVKSSRKELIRQRMKEVDCSYDTIVNMLRLYWKRGMTYQALRPDFHKCGTIKDPEHARQVKENVKLGAPRTVNPGTGVNIIGDYIKKAIKQGAELWVKSKTRSLKDAYDHMVRIFFSKAIKDQNGTIKKYQLDNDKKPSQRQLQYYITKTYPYGKLRRRRHGQKNWDKKERPITGRADGDVQGPGERFQIDATIADVYLVSSKDRNRIVGRPVIYFIIDVFSRLITGVYVGFEGPSWVGAMMALTNMVMDKVDFCRKYEIDIEAEEWPSQDAPRRIMGDRGELISVDLGQYIVENLKIEIENASPGRADLKALVERLFGTVPAKFRPFTPGYVEKDFNERGAEDYRLKATLNLHEFTQLVILAVLEHNEEPIEGIEIPAEIVTAGLTGCPLDLWEWGIHNRSGKLKRLSLDQVRLNVMPRDDARVTARGIHFKKGYYTCETAVRDEWFAKARRDTWTVSVSYDPRDLSILYIHDPKFTKGFEVCRLLDSSSDLKGVSLFEAEEIDFERKRIEAQGEDDRQANRLLTDRRMEDIKRKASKETNAVRDLSVSKSEKTRNIRSNKADEKEFHRKSEKFDLNDSLAETDNARSEIKPVIRIDDYRDNELAMLEVKRNRREGR